MPQHESGDDLFERFSIGGFEQLVNDEPRRLADFLEDVAARTGSSAQLFLSQAIRAVDALCHDHDESGGTSLNFIRQLDQLVRHQITEIHGADASTAATKARALRDEVFARVQAYNPHNLERLV